VGRMKAKSLPPQYFLRRLKSVGSERHLLSATGCPTYCHINPPCLIDSVGDVELITISSLASFKHWMYTSLKIRALALVVVPLSITPSLLLLINISIQRSSKSPSVLSINQFWIQSN
jgi:hypothetical protein